MKYTKYKIYNYIGIVFIPLLPSCISAAEPTVDNQSKSYQDKNFTSIQKSLQQMNKNLQTLPAQQTAKLSATNDLETTGDNQVKNQNDTSNSLNQKMGRNKMGMMTKKKNCMGRMCKMMMKNKSMMGTKPLPEKQGSLSTKTDVLPGYQDAPHLYHLGEADFFLDYVSELELTSGQVEQLFNIKQQWGITQREKVTLREQLEKRLWKETASGMPNLNEVRDTLSEIASVNSTLRLSFIEMVGQSVDVLLPQQVELIKKINISKEFDSKE